MMGPRISLLATLWGSLSLAASASPATGHGQLRSLRGASGGAERQEPRAEPMARAGYGPGHLVNRSSFPEDWPFLKRCLDPKSPGGLLNMSLPACGQDRESDLKPDARIVVVGGGPAGTSMAKLLHDRGFRRVTLFEALGRLGGKSKRFDVNGEAHETGTCYLSGKYECIEAWAKSVGMTEVMVDKARLVESEEAVLQNMSAPAFGKMWQYMTDYAFRRYGVPADRFATEFFQARIAYKTHWASTMGEYDFMFPSNASQVDFVALNQTFESWLAERNLTALVPFLLFAMSGQGYGAVDKMPAFYGLTWVHPNFLYESSRSFFAMFKEGYETLWERLIASTGIDVRLNTRVSRIQRRDEGVVVEYGAGGRETFDWLVMAAPMPQALALMSDATHEERDLFGVYSYHELTLSVLKTNSTGSLPSDYQLFTWADRLSKQSDYYRMSLSEQGKVVREMYDFDQDDGPVTLRNDFNIEHLSGDAVAILTFSAPNTTEAELTEAIDRDVSKYGLKMDLLHRERWDYMPFYTVGEVVRERKPWRIWELQGKRHTWWAGSYASFESVADVLDYNLHLVNSRLCQ